MYFISQNSFSFSCSKCNVMQCVTQQCFWMVVTLSWASLDWFWIKKQKKRWWRKCQSVAKVLTTWKLWKPTENLFCFIEAVLKRVIRERGGFLYIFLSFLSCLEEFKVCLPGVYQLIQLTVSCCHFPFVLTCHPFVFRFTLAADCRITRCYLSGDNAVTCICFQTTNHLVIQVSGKKTKVFVLDVGCAIFTSQQGNYLHWQNHVVCHNDTQDIAAIWEHQHWPDHNETATLYLAMFGEKQSITTLCCLRMKTDVNKSSGFIFIFFKACLAFWK